VVIFPARPSCPISARNFDRVAAAGGRGGKGVLARLRDPEPALGVEGEVHRFADLRLGRHQLNFNPGGRWKPCRSASGVRGSVVANKFGEGIGGRETLSHQDPRCQKEPTGRMAKRLDDCEREADFMMCVKIAACPVLTIPKFGAARAAAWIQESVRTP